MRILLSAYACEPNRGSEAGNGWNWSRSLALRGHTIHLLTRIQGRDAIEKELSKHKISNLIVHYIDVPAWSKKFLSGQLGIYFHYLLWQKQAYLFSKTIVDQIDVLHHISWGSLRGGSHLWKINKPFIFGPIGGGQVAPKCFSEYFEDEWFKESLRTASITHFNLIFPESVKTIQNADLVLCCNQDTHNIVRKNNPNKTELFLDAGLPLDFISDTIPDRQLSETLRILWVGRIYPIKGLKLALLALANVHVPYKLNIVGNGPWGFKIPGWIKSMGLEKNVEWFGQLPWEDLKNIYSLNDVFLFTSLRESFGSQLLEAMAYGLPIVTLDHFGARDFVPDEVGIKIPVTTSDEVIQKMASAIEKIYSDLQLRKKMGQAGYEYAKSQVWDKKAAIMEDIYLSVLQRKQTL